MTRSLFPLQFEKIKGCWEHFTSKSHGAVDATKSMQTSRFVSSKSYSNPSDLSCRFFKEKFAACGKMNLISGPDKKDF